MCIIVLSGKLHIKNELGVFFKDLKGKLVQFQRGPATVNGSELQHATVQHCMGRRSKH